MIIYLSEVGVSYTQIGTLYAIRKLVAFFLEIPTGILADSLGRKLSLATSFFAYIIAFIGIYYSTNFFLLVAAFSIFGLGETLRSGSHKAIIVSYLEEKGWMHLKTDYFANTRAWAQFGSGISSLVAGFLVLYSGEFKSIFLYSVIPYIINFFNLLTYPKSLDEGGKKKKKKTQSNFIKELWVVLKQRQLIKVITNATVLSSFLGASKDFIQPMMAAFALTLPFLGFIDDDKQKVGLVVGVLYFGIYMMTSRAAVISKSVKKKIPNQERFIINTLIIGLLLGITAGLMYEINLIFLAIVVFTLVYITDSLRKPILTSYMADDSPTEMLTTVLSVDSFVLTVFTALLSFIFGFLCDYLSIGNALILLGASLLVFYGMTKLFFKEKIIQ
ncbi:MFS transporter [Flammeovirga aprica]|uniref:MFS transporter n=1 Tax=Flammeovirga aprica JL-4 TaxID=694437 RepID=A0A7X9RVL7_9BACT|nr:MFS transporter [Flammeovirga aprica JL-4]